MKKPTLEQLCQYPILSESGATGRQVQDKVFQAAGLTPTTKMTVMDAGVAQALRIGFGIETISLVANDSDVPRSRGYQSGVSVRFAWPRICLARASLQNWRLSIKFFPISIKEMIQNVMRESTQARTI